MIYKGWYAIKLIKQPAYYIKWYGNSKQFYDY